MENYYTANVHSSVSRGTAFSQLYFVSYINYIADIIKNCDIKIVADVSEIMKVINEVDNWACLQTDLLAVI